MTTPLTPVSTSATSSLRLRLRPGAGTGPTSSPLDGAWWPRSRDLAAEIPDLVDHFPAGAGRIARILYSTPDWAATLRKTRVARGFIKLGTFPDDDTHLITAVMSDRSRLHLLVVPPSSTGEDAERLMDAAASGGASDAGQLLATVGDPGA